MLTKLRYAWGALLVILECVWLFVRLPEGEQERELAILRARRRRRRAKRYSR